ncbi:MAG: hypothetical protein RR324_01135 [Cellulosilyticaceae bacterium]
MNKMFISALTMEELLAKQDKNGRVLLDAKGYPMIEVSLKQNSMSSDTKTQLEHLRDIIWGEDIASPTCPEYIEHHHSIQIIMAALDEILEEA